MISIATKKSADAYQGESNNPKRVMFEHIRKYDQHEDVGSVPWIKKSKHVNQFKITGS